MRITHILFSKIRHIYDIFIIAYLFVNIKYFVDMFVNLRLCFVNKQNCIFYMSVKVHFYEQDILKHHKSVQFNIKYRMTVYVDTIRYKTVQFKTRVIKNKFDYSLYLLCIFSMCFWKSSTTFCGLSITARLPNPQIQPKN